MMTFGQPNDLTRTSNHLMDQLGAGQPIVLTFAHVDLKNGAADEVLALVHEAARLRHLDIKVNLKPQAGVIVVQQEQSTRGVPKWDAPSSFFPAPLIVAVQ